MTSLVSSLEVLRDVPMGHSYFQQILPHVSLDCKKQSISSSIRYGMSHPVSFLVLGELLATDFCHLFSYLGLGKDILSTLIFCFMRRQLYVCVTGKWHFFRDVKAEGQ